MPIVSLAELKTDIGIIGTQDDQVLSSSIIEAEDRIERDTGRAFSYSSNVTRTYSSEGAAALFIRDVPAYASNTLSVTVSGAAMVYGESFWLLPDRRNPDVSVTIQLRPFDRSNPEWYKAFPNWFDANMDSGRWAASLGSPNDVIVTGPEGHPVTPRDVVGMMKAMATLIYWQKKSGASGTVQTPNGETIDLSSDPIGYAEFVKAWKVRTAVAGI